MIINHTVNWEKTCLNIKNRLSSLTHMKNMAPIMCLSERQIQHKLSGQHLSVEELYIFASFLKCSIEELLIFEDDEFIIPERYPATTQSLLEYSSPTEIAEHINFNAQKKSNYDIQNLKEFFLYLPLMNSDILNDVAFRCYGNLSYHNNDYFYIQMQCLYRSIPDTPAKQFADSYKNDVLRKKGDPESRYLVNNLNTTNNYKEDCYWLDLCRFSNRFSYKTNLSYREN